MKRDMRVYIEDILESIAKIEEYLKEASSEDFRAKSLLQDAVARRLEIIGEAAKNVSEELRERYSDIPWKKMAGLRDVLIHQYFAVNLERAWKLVKEELPALKKKVRQVKVHLDGEARK